MLSLTQKALEDFDNQHDFERMCAAIMNAQENYQNIVLVAPRGGSDGGRDITFETVDGKKGLACCTLRKDISKKFYEDFKQRAEGDFDNYLFFCNSYLTASQKGDFTKFCKDNLKAQLIPQDIEALRSLLDGNYRLNDIKQIFLNISDIGIKQVVQSTAIEIHYQSNFSEFLIDGELGNYKSKLKIFNLTKKIPYFSFSGFIAPINGCLIGPYSTAYEHINEMKPNGNEPLKLPSHGNISIPISDIVNNYFPIKDYLTKKSSNIKLNPFLKPLGFKTPTGNLIFEQNSSIVEIPAIAYHPDLPEVTPFRGLGIVLNLEFAYYDEGYKIIRTLYGGIALKSKDEKFKTVCNNVKNIKEGVALQFLDNFSISPFLIIQKLETNEKNSITWYKKIEKETVVKKDAFAENKQKSTKDMVISVSQVSIERGIGSCPTICDCLIIAPVRKYMSDRLEF